MAGWHQPLGACPLTVIIDDDHFIASVFFRQIDTDVFPQKRGKISTDKISAYRQFTVPSVNEDGKLNRFGAAKVYQSVHGCPNGSPGKEDIVDKELKFSENAMGDLFIISAKVDEFLKMVSEALIKQPADLLARGEATELAIDSMREAMRDKHIERLKIGKCGIEGGLTFINLLARLEKIGDYCYSITRSLATQR